MSISLGRLPLCQTALAALLLATIALPARAIGEPARIRPAECFFACDSPLPGAEQDDLKEGDAYYNQGLAFHKAGEEEKALAAYSRALTKFEKIGNQPYVADALFNMGISNHALHEEQVARDLRPRARDLSKRRQPIAGRQRPPEYGSLLRRFGSVR